MGHIFKWKLQKYYLCYNDFSPQQPLYSELIYLSSVSSISTVSSASTMVLPLYIIHESLTHIK